MKKALLWILVLLVPLTTYELTSFMDIINLIDSEVQTIIFVLFAIYLSTSVLLIVTIAVMQEKQIILIIVIYACLLIAFLIIEGKEVGSLEYIYLAKTVEQNKEIRMYVKKIARDHKITYDDFKKILSKEKELENKKEEEQEIQEINKKKRELFGKTKS